MASSTMSVSGVVSGMDWESMIDTLIEKAAKPAQVQVSKRTNLVNKKSLFEEMKVTMNSIQSSLSPLKLPSTYKAKEIEIERIDTTGSYKGVLTATVNADAEVNVYDLEVKQLARAQTNRSKQITASNLKTTLGGLESSTLYINAGGQKVGIDVYDSDTLESLKSRINTTLKTLSTPLGITASVVDSKLILKTDNTGLGTSSVSGTASQRYNTDGFTSLDTIILDADAGTSTNIVVDNSNVENVKVSSGTSTYSIHKDYEIVNNQIRWKQYEDTDNVKLGESVTASYTMGVGDVYTKTAKRNSDKSSDTIIFGLDVVDQGTLSQRMKIRGQNTTSTTETEEKYLLDDDEEVGTTTNTVTTKDENGDDVITKTTVKITSKEDEDGETYYEVETKVDVTKMTDFIYGKDFTYSGGVITWLEPEEETTTTNEPESYTVSFSKKSTVDYSVSGDKDEETIEKTYTTEPDTYSVKIKSETTTSYGLTTTKTTSGATGDNIALDFEELYTKYQEATGEDLTLTPVGSSGWGVYLDPGSKYRSAFNITANGTTYEYGRDFVIQTIDKTTTNTSSNNFTIVWGRGPSDSTTGGIVANYASNRSISDTALNAPERYTELKFSFTSTKETTLSGKVSKTDNDKTLETIFGEAVDEEYYSSLTIRGYDYNVDYTVNDDGEIEWLEQTSTSYLNSDEDATEFDVDEFNTAYKNATGSEISTLTLTGSDGVIRTYLDPEDRSLFTLTDDDENEYQYGRDYVIRVKDDGDGYVLSWFAADDKTGDGAIDANDASIIVSTYAQAKNISTLNFKTAPEDGTGYTFGFSAELTNEYSGSVKASDEDKDLSLSALFGDDLELDEDDYADIVITDSDGKTYTYVESEDDLTDDTFTIVDGEIVWKTETTDGAEYTPNAPENGSEYTIYYESIKAIEAAATNDSDNVEIKLANDYGNISDTDDSYLSYEQILKDANSKLTVDSDESDIDEALEKYFTITGSDGTTYSYGTDFRVAMGDEDTDSGQHKAVIEWLSGGYEPSLNEAITITYTGRGEGGEVFRIENAVTRSNSDAVLSGSSGAPDYDEFKAGTTTITQGTKTFFEGIDFEVGTNDAGNVLINWKTGTDYEWYFPSGQYAQYTVNLTTSDGETKSYSAARGYEDTLDLRNHGFTTVSNNGTLNSISYNGTVYDLTSSIRNDDGKTPSEVVKETLGIDINNGTNGGVRVFNFDWVTPTLTSREGLPGYGDEISVEYEYNANTFTLSDDGDNLVNLLGLNDDVTEAQNAVLVLDGEEVERDLNDIGESYGTELIKGMTIHLKGTGEVSMDVSHDAEKAVTSIQTFVENYNSLMSWMNTRMTESEVDEDTKATVDSDDFRMRWGLLHGNSLLRNTKSQMRDTVAQNFTFSFTSRTSSEEVYGPMSYNGLRNDATLRLRIGNKYVDVSILRTDTLEDIVNKISDSSDPAMRNIFYDDNGQLLAEPLIKAKVEGDKLVINSTTDDQITISGSAAMNALKMNYTYKGVYQLGIATTSTDYGKSGELEFDTEKFMEALEDNPDEVEDLMLKFASAMDTWTKSMLNSSASGQTSGTLTRQISDLETQISSIDEYLEKYQDRLDRMEDNLRTKYAAAEQQISKLSQQASAISAILQQLSGNSNNNNSNS